MIGWCPVILSLFHDKKAFTLLEILIVISILTTFLGAVIFPSRNLYRSYRNGSFVQSIIFELHNARFHARLSGEPAVASFKNSIFTVSIGEKRIVEKRLYLAVQKDKSFTFLPSGLPLSPGTVLFLEANDKPGKIILSKQGRIRYER